jgi:hypothetical protein
MQSQELHCIQKVRLLHKDCSMRLEALGNGLPIDMSKLEEISDCTFLSDIKLLCEDIESCPCFARLEQLYTTTQVLVKQFIKHPTGKKSPQILDIVSEMNRLIETFDILEQWISMKEEAQVQQVIQKQEVSAEDVLDTLEKTVQELDELLHKKD